MVADALPSWLRPSRLPLVLAVGLLLARLTSLLTFTPDGLRGYGDFIIFFQVADLPGWPYLHYWVEYPPLFSFINELLYRLAGGQQHVHHYLLVLLLMLFDSGSVYLFSRLALRLHHPERGLFRAIVYLLTLSTLAYAWWNFDPLAIFWMLLGLTLLTERRWAAAGLAVGVGMAAKLFPFLAILAAWRRCTWRQMALLVTLALAPLALMYAALWLASPDYTLASMRSQFSKGSWETVWALLDENIRTGSFGPVSDRMDVTKALQSGAASPVVPPLLSLAVLGGIGLWFLFRVRPKTDYQSIVLVAFGWTLFTLWSPGWSPQWVLFMVPLVLLALPDHLAVLFTILLVMVNILEWPVLLSRGYFHLLWAPVLLRTALHLILTVSLAEILLGRAKTPEPAALPAEPGEMV